MELLLAGETDAKCSAINACTHIVDLFLFFLTYFFIYLVDNVNTPFYSIHWNYPGFKQSEVT